MLMDGERYGRLADLRIVMVEPQPEAASVLQSLLSETGHEVHLARGIEDATRLVTQLEMALVLVIEAEPRFETDTLSAALRTAGYNGRIFSTERLGAVGDTVPPPHGKQ
ncbi:MAG TPA: hypothetical protein VHV31_13325 [Nitrolancea sp.]|jgi:CheY-like chemotaxis protein|nr:hypothetical protein [Nitrolancea sp.]